ncbi:NfrA family protein [Pseudomonas sp. FEN]|uniref:NfrA family protein n=1 Tax=Pseudomonas sp. FEN TaxID=2767468 RepID=UPI001749E16B|nr:phage receptor [Pseudomonas sp. FEN]
MKPGIRHQVLLGGLLLGLGAASWVDAAPLSDFDQFRSYPYMDRSYREAKNGNWSEVERLMRHLLTQVPDNEEARAMLVESLAKQRRYKEAVQALPDTPGNRDALLELRLTWIEQDPPAAEEVESWIASGPANQRERLWQSYSLSLAKRGGAARAHDWLAHLPSQGNDNLLHQARANWAEQMRDWDAVIQELAPLAERKQLDAEGWRRLASAYVQRLEDQPLQDLLRQAPTADAAHQVRLAMVDRAIAMGHIQQAQRWMQSVPAGELDAPGQRQRLWELARQTGDSATVQRLSGELQRPCLETAEWLSRRDPQAALVQLRGCSPNDDPQTWLVLAQRLQASELLQSQRLPEPWDSKRREDLLDVWQQQGQSDKIMAWLVSQPQTADVVKRRAERLQALGRNAEAATLWERHYQQTGNLESLNQATYLALNNGQRDHTQQLLEEAFDCHDAHLPAAMLQRLAGLYDSSSTATPAQQKRMALLLSRVDPATRDQLLGQLAENGQCDAVRQAIAAQPADAGEFRALGRCAMPGRPGEAVVYYQAAETLGDRASRLPLAYALEASGDSAGALRIWRDTPDRELTENARLTASRSALTVGDTDAAERYWQQSRTRGGNEWSLGAAIAQARGNYALALERQRQALQLSPDAEHFYAASVIAQKAGDLPQSTAWLAEAVRREPNNPRYSADYGMRLAGAETAPERADAIPYLQTATQHFPEDYALGETLAWRYDEVEDSASARKELRRVIDLEQNPLVGGDGDNLEALRYRQRRAHEALSRRDSRTLASTWSPAGVSTNDILRPDNSQGTVRHAASQNVQVAMWDHALGDEPSRAGSTLSVYGRALLGGAGRSSYAESVGTGLGLRYKPWGTANINFYAEIYKQNTFDSQDKQGLSLGELLNPGQLWDQLNDHRKDGHTNTDYLLRTTASFLDQGRFRNDWRVDESDWEERFLYLDAAWWTKSGDHQWLSRFQQGHAWKLPFNSAQTIMPYGFLEFASQDPNNAWRQDLRAGLGLRWQWWFDDDIYNAYRAHLTVRTEYQQALGGNLYEGGNGVLLGVELNF